MSGRWPLFLFVLASVVGCKRDEPEPAPATAMEVPSLHPHLHLAVDSACINMGNVVTNNGDGLNELLRIVAINVVNVNVEVRNASGVVLYEGDAAGLSNPDLLPVPASDETPVKLTCAVQATSTSGQSMTGSAVIYVISDITTHCFTDAVAPVTTDQFFNYATLETTCDPVSLSNDVFCIQ